MITAFMAEYRAYLLDEGNRITRRIDFEATDDHAAIRHARHHLAKQHIELWQGSRMLIRFNPPTNVAATAESAQSMP